MWSIGTEYDKRERKHQLAPRGGAAEVRLHLLFSTAADLLKRRENGLCATKYLTPPAVEFKSFSLLFWPFHPIHSRCEPELCKQSMVLANDIKSQ